MALAAINYESANNRFPPGRLAPDFAINGTQTTGYTNYNQVVQSSPIFKTGFYSVHVWLLPYMEESAIFNLINFDVAQTDRMTTNGEPSNINYNAYANAANLFICPSDVNTERTISENNYRYNFGGSTPYAGAPNKSKIDQFKAEKGGISIGGNGAFTIGKHGLRASRYFDGLSNTCFFAERDKGSGIGEDRGRCGASLPTKVDIARPNGINKGADGFVDIDAVFQTCGNWQPHSSQWNFCGTGRWLPGSDYSNGWPFAGYVNTQYNHVAPPNWSGYDCTLQDGIPDTPAEAAIISARSSHPGVVVAGFGDGHVESASESIDVHVWRALGSRNGGEAVSDY